MFLPFGPIATILGHISKGQHGNSGWVFFFSLLGITPLVERIGFVIERLAFFTGPIVGGLLNATFGNTTEDNLDFDSCWYNIHKSCWFSTISISVGYSLLAQEGVFLMH